MTHSILHAWLLLLLYYYYFYIFFHHFWWYHHHFPPEVAPFSRFFCMYKVTLPCIVDHNSLMRALDWAEASEYFTPDIDPSDSWLV